ncbi:MAG: DNA repair protein RecO [Prevotella sp.]|nr:DNA repair protein RecO [Prevotella sp.]MBR4898966.1 DNA repair protein RecO [Prevotella sp.]
MLTKTEAIVLHSLKYGDQRAIVDLFTRDHGRVSFIVSLPRSAKGRMKKQYFQPLTLLSIEYDFRPQSQLQKLREVSLLQPLASLHTDPSKLAIALFLSDFLYHALRGEQQNEPLFDYVVSGIEWLDSCRDRFANFHLVFLMRLSRFLGFYPNLDHDDDNCCFDLRAATFTEHPPVHADFLMPEEARHIKRLMRMDYVSMHLFRLSRSERQRILQLLLTYYRLHLPDFPELRSVDVLQELFS